MTPEFRKQWVASLRSGQYQQSRGHLRIGPDNAPTHCCLGVALDQQDSCGWVPALYRSAMDHGMLRSNELGHELFYRLDLDSNFAFFLAKLNDSKRSFKEIADCIENADECLFAHANSGSQRNIDIVMRYGELYFSEPSQLGPEFADYNSFSAHAYQQIQQQAQVIVQQMMLTPPPTWSDIDLEIASIAPPDFAAVEARIEAAKDKGLIVCEAPDWNTMAFGKLTPPLTGTPEHAKQLQAA